MPNVFVPPRSINALVAHLSENPALVMIDPDGKPHERRFLGLEKGRFTFWENGQSCQFPLSCEGNESGIRFAKNGFVLSACGRKWKYRYVS